MREKTEFPPPLAAARKAWLFLCLLAHPRFARKLGTLVTEGYLARTGWVRSVLTASIVDADGAPLPWMARPFVDFVAPRLHGKMRIFEYGSGASTLFFARRAGWVMAVEHDAVFAAALAPQLPANARVIVRPQGSVGYVNAITEMAERPHLVSIDGSDRAGCAETAMAHLSEDGVLILDDSELPEYALIREKMKESGFRALDFWGLAPTRIEHRCTTVFYRPNNALGI